MVSLFSSHFHGLTSSLRFPKYSQIPRKPELLILGGSRFWFWVPFRQNGIKKGINLNYDWTTLFHFLFHTVSLPKRKRINNSNWNCLFFWDTSPFGCKMENVWCTYRKFAKLLDNNNLKFWRLDRKDTISSCFLFWKNINNRDPDFHNDLRDPSE